MITLSVFIIFGTICGWCSRYTNSLIGKYKFNPFDELPTGETILLVVGTVYSIIITIYVIAKFCP